MTGRVVSDVAESPFDVPREITPAVGEEGDAFLHDMAIFTLTNNARIDY